MKESPTMFLRHSHRGRVMLSMLLIGITVFASASQTYAEGSRSLYPDNTTGFRANLEWRNSTYGGMLLRRTLLKVYARQGEYIFLGSSAIDVPDAPDNGDIRVYDPGLVTGAIGKENIPNAPSFSCVTQREQTRNRQQGRIASRLQEIRGPDTIVDERTAARGGVVPEGFVPCYYQAKKSGIYDVVFYGPTGDNADTQNPPTGSIADDPDNFTAAQDTNVAAWDVTVRASLTSTTNLDGRLFSYYLAMFTGGNGRPVDSIVYVVTTDGYRYRVNLRGMDPNGFVLYGNQVGFLDSDGSPLYRDVVAERGLTFDQQNQLVKLQGDVTLAPPEYPIFFHEPDPATLEAIGITLNPVIPEVKDLTFTGPGGGSTTEVGMGGTFSFTSNVGGVFELIISRDGLNFDPTAAENRVLRGIRKVSGPTTVAWDGLDNSGKPFPIGDNYQARTMVHGGEFHFPFLDVENSISGSPYFTLINPPGGICPPLIGGCSGGVYDDRGYRTANGTLVGTRINGPLCPGNVGNPPQPLFSDPIVGFDSTSTQRRFGFPNEGNPDGVCEADGGFGDKKGLDLWAFYPSNLVQTSFSIISPKAIELVSFTASAEADGVAVRWTTSAEQNTWGFHLYRSEDGRRERATRVTSELIPGRGRGQGGASYHWIDRAARPGQSYSYWLQEVEISGNINEYGPATTATTNAASRWYIFSPLVSG